MRIENYIDIANERRKDFEFFKENILPHTLKWEGGAKLHNVKGDSGGWTKYGIAYNKNRKHFKNLPDFKDTTYEEASAFAFVNYYLSIECYRVPRSAQLYYFDMAYNLGSHRAIRYVQRCAGVGDDGIIGEVTRRYMHKVTLECLHKQRVGWYDWLLNRRSWAGKFYKGWTNRSKDIFRISKSNK